MEKVSFSSFQIIFFCFLMVCFQKVFGAENRDYLCFTAEQANSRISFTVTGNKTYFNDFFVISYDTLTWKSIALNTDTITLANAGDKVYFKISESKSSSLAKDNLGLMYCSESGGVIRPAVAFSFWMSGLISASGNVMSLLDPTCQMMRMPSRPVGCFYGLFKDCTALITAPDLPATDLAQYCYASMFEGCTRLSEAPKMNAYNLDKACCERMFYGCTSLRDGPVLYSNTLVERCYKEMFAKCSDLSSISVSFSDWQTSVNATYQWMQDVQMAGGNFYAPARLLASFGYTNIPNNWTVIPTATDYFRVVSNETCLVKFSSYRGEGTKAPALKYSRNGGIDWTVYQIEIPIELNKGDSVCFSAIYAQNAFSTSPDNTYNLNVYKSTGAVSAVSPLASVRGNILHLLDPLASITELVTSYCFNQLFSGGLYDFDNITLPSKILSAYCYKNMFSRCRFLTRMPDLLAQNIADGCYEAMFANCDGLETISRLPAQNLAKGCYAQMFEGCNGLTQIPYNMLPASQMAEKCYYSMFAHCKKLTNCPTLASTNLAASCYASMFENDSSLTDIPDLPATQLYKGVYANMFSNCKSLERTMTLPARHLADSCYAGMFTLCSNLTDCPAIINADIAYPFCCYRMFADCEKLTTAPTLSAKILGENCYAEMFLRCRVLTSAPSLPAPQLVSGCYREMFRGCISLGLIDVGFNEWAEGATTGWVDFGLSTTGVFKCPMWLQQQFGDDFIPSAWKVDIQTLTLYDDVAPSSTLQMALDHQPSFDSVELRRTFVGNGQYNSLCLPFSINQAAWSNPLTNPLYGVNLYEFKQSILADDSLIVLLQPTDHILAGHPYMIRWNEGATIPNNPVFTNVTIERSDVQEGDKIELEHIVFAGTLSPLSLRQTDNNDSLLLKDGQNVGSMDIFDTQLKGFRTYGILKINTPLSFVSIDTHYPVNTHDGFIDVVLAQQGSRKKILVGERIVIVAEGILYDLLGNRIGQ